jgi:hypothetical protein
VNIFDPVDVAIASITATFIMALITAGTIIDAVKVHRENKKLKRARTLEEVAILQRPS